jgi:iron transport multicopper oxidase
LQHWHGLFQKHTNYVDGPSFVTQCPLIPGESFLYEFNGQDQTVWGHAPIKRLRLAHLVLFQGTYWYHSHFRNQYCDGLRGALIIDDPNDPQTHLYDVDDGGIGF